MHDNFKKGIFSDFDENEFENMTNLLDKVLFKMENLE